MPEHQDSSTESAPGRQSVVFICTGNSARSQMAEALLRHLAGDRYDAYSAGLEPKGVHPLTIQALTEAGIGTDGLRSKHVKEFLGRSRVHHAIVVCHSAQKRCPSIFPFSTWTHFWPFDDPAAARGTREQQLAVFRKVRDQIARRLHDWLANVDDP
jgi:arsenate reductase